MISLRQSDSHGETLHNLTPDLTPMLDILFILLVFFMITSGASFQSLDLKLPSSVSEEISLMNKPKHMMLEIHENYYAIDGKRIADFESLKIAVTDAIQVKPEHELIIAGDKRIAIEKLLKVLTYLQSQGIVAANILMQNKETK